MAKLTINRGTTYSRTVTYMVNGVVTTLVGATIFFTLKTNEFDDDATDTSAIVKKTLVQANGDIPLASTGIATITLAPGDTDLVTPGKYYYDIKVKDSTGAVYKLDEGTVKLDGSATNRLS